MSQLNQTNEYKRLYEQYSKKSNKELSEIMKPENGYTEEAVKAASDILQSDRTDYYKDVELQHELIEEKQKINQDEILTNISRDIHSIKNMLLFFVILTILGIISALFFGYEIQSYFQSLLYHNLVCY